MRPWLTAVLVVAASWGQTAYSQSAPTRPFSEEVSKQSAIYKSVGQQVPDGYVVDRSLLSYAFILPPDFKQSLANLGPQDRWLDIGAGEGRAIIDYCTSKYDAMLQDDPESKAKAVAISIEDRRTPHWHQAAQSLREKQIEYLFGKSLRDYTQEELGQFQVITDVLGAFSYTQNLSLSMEKILGFLAVNGSFYSVLQDVHGENGSNRPYYPGASYLTELVGTDGSEMKVCSWLKSISCVEVTCDLNSQMQPPVEVYRIRKTCDKVAVPALTPIHFEAGTPPERRFQLKKAFSGSMQRIGETR